MTISLSEIFVKNYFPVDLRGGEVYACFSDNVATAPGPPAPPLAPMKYLGSTEERRSVVGTGGARASTIWARPPSCGEVVPLEVV
jgi:hypothetical protein